VTENIKALMDNPARLSRLFRALSDAEFESLMSNADLMNLPIGTAIFRTRDNIEHLYVLLSGKLRFTVQTDGQQKDQTLFSANRTGDIAGTSSTNTIATYGVRTSADSQVLRISAAALQAIRSSNPQFIATIERELRLISWHEKLQGSSIAQIISPHNLRLVLSHAEPVILEKGARIPEAWSHADSLAFIVDGKLNGFEGEELRPGDHLSAPEELNGHPLPLPSAKERSQVLVLNNTNLNLLFKEFAGIEPEIMIYKRKIADRLENLRQSTRIQKIESLNVAKQAEKAQPFEQKPEGFFARLKKDMGYYPVLFQQNAMDCGSTCIAMVALHYGQRLDLNRVRQLANVGVGGTSLYALAQAAEELGFTTRGISATYEGLLKSKLPLICFWRNEHFVVLFKAGEKLAIVGDPAEGLLRLTPEDFSKSFSDVALELTPTQKLGSAAKATTILNRLFAFLVPYKWEVIHVFSATLLYQTLMLIIPLFTQVIVDKVVVHQSLPLLNTMTLGMAIFAIFETIVTFIRGYMQAYLAIRLDQSLIIQFFRHLLSLPFKFFEDRTIGDVITRFGENAKIREFLAGSSITVLLDVLVLLIYLVVIFAYNLGFGAAVLLYLAAFTVLVAVYTPILKHFGRKVFNRTAESQSFVIESIRSIQLVKGAAAEQRIRWKWELLLAEQLEARFKELLANNTVQALSRMLQLSGQILILYLGAHLVVEGKLTIGQLMALNMMFGMIATPVMRIVEMWSGFQDVNVAMERLCDVLDHDPEEEPGTSRIRLESIKGHIQFQNVTFRYNNEAKSNALDNVSFEVQPGQLAAFVGRSGCGKTTILKMIQGLYKPNEGKIKIDGVDLAHVSLPMYRQQTGVVSQNEYLFRGTIRENLTFNKPTATMQELVEAATIAGIHRQIMNMPMGYDSVISEGGFNISGGERQRLAIARAILHKPSILLFDEATSALDTESERHIQESMELIRAHHTMIVLAHRLSTIKDADIIFVVDHGRIVESGTYQTLLDARGLFYHLCKQQLSS
jgi:ATP-binding cassette subfamily B protein